MIEGSIITMRRVGDDATDPVEEALVIALARNIYETRKSRGLTQSQLARMSGVTQSYINVIEGNGANISFKGIIKIAKALEIGLSDLIPKNQYDDSSNRDIDKIASVLDRVALIMEISGKSFDGLLNELKGIQDLREELRRAIASRKESS